MNKEFIVPTSLNDVSFEKYIYFHKQIKKQPQLSGLMLAVKVVQLMCDISDADINNMPLSDIKNGAAHISSILNVSNIQYNENEIEVLKVGEKMLYKPKDAFRLFADPKKLGHETLGTFVDCMNIHKYMAQLDKGNDISAIPYLIAILFREKGEFLPISENERDYYIHKKAKLIEKELTAYQAVLVSFFLAIQSKASKLVTLIYLESLK